MNCVLCLELPEDPAANLNITEGQDIRCTIKIHFSWLKIDDVITAESCICHQCWQTLLTFHKFYIQVERAHKLLECDQKPAENCEFSEQLSQAEAAPTEKEDAKVEVGQIKIEPESICLEAAKPKRRQGRTRKNKLVEENVEGTRAARRRAVSASKPETKIEEFYVPTVKDENMEVEGVLAGVDVLKSGNASEAEAQSTGPMSTDDNLEDTDDPVALEKSSKKILTSRQSDEFIAKHFRLNCNICSVELEDFSTLRSHFRKEHKVRGYVLCCGKKLLNRCLLVDHLHMHEDPAYFSCPHCGKQLANRNCLELHMQRHGEKRERNYECEICHKKFYLSSACRRHKLLHLPEEKKTVPCPECEKNFATQSVMTEHLRMVHLNVYAKICDICGKSLVGREALRRHLEEHTEPRPSKKCELCGVTLSSELGLARHMKAIHLEENRQPQVCPICSKVSPGLRAHKHHMNYMHNMQRKHVCPMCAKAFKRPTDLKEHMTTHTGEVLYTCPHCPKTFNSNANMHSHRKKVHRKEWEEKRSQRISQVPPKDETPETLPP